MQRLCSLSNSYWQHSCVAMEEYIHALLTTHCPKMATFNRRLFHLQLLLQKSFLTTSLLTIASEKMCYKLVDA